MAPVVPKSNASSLRWPATVRNVWDSDEPTPVLSPGFSTTAVCPSVAGCRRSDVAVPTRSFTVQPSNPDSKLPLWNGGAGHNATVSPTTTTATAAASQIHDQRSDDDETSACDVVVVSTRWVAEGIIWWRRPARDAVPNPSMRCPGRPLEVPGRGADSRTRDRTSPTHDSRTAADPRSSRSTGAAPPRTRSADPARPGPA